MAPSADARELLEQLSLEAEQIAEREHRYRTIVNGVRDAIILHDPRGIILEVNDAACESLGYTREALVSGMYVHEAEANLTKIPLAKRGQEWATFAAGEWRTVDSTMLRKDGSTFPAEVRVGRHHEGKSDVFVAVVRDVSEHKRNEAALARYRKDLEEEVKSRTAELERANTELERARDEAEDASRAKSQFLANMSHELRTPLNAIIGYSEMMQEEAEDLGATSLVSDLEKVGEAGTHLLGLIGNILDLSKIEAGKMEIFIEHTDLGAQCQSVVTTLGPLIHKSGNKLQTQGIAGFGVGKTDITKLRQILFNLLANANKFTERGVVSLSATIEPGPPRRARFVIEDTGVGMSANQLDRLFEAFTQADASTTRKYGGTGLGLALSRHLARMLGGDITVTSVETEGTRLEVTLPIGEQPEQGQDPSAPAGVGRLAGLLSGEGAAVAEGAQEVLVIDDDPNMRAFLERFLRKEGYQPLLAIDGPSGLKLARERRPMAITLDVMMPGMDGWDVMATLKADDDLSHIPIIFVTMLEDRGLAFGLGATEFLTKPIDRAQLARVLRRYRCDDPPCDALIVDDDKNQRDILARTLTRAGWEVRSAKNGREGLERVREHAPALILLDLMMPELDGFGFLAEIQADTAFCEIPVVVLTAKSLDDGDRERLRGAADVFEKGAIGGEALVAHLSELLQQCRISTTAEKLPGEV